MIIVQLKGGLGNQLFQYAAGLSLARHHNVQVKVDISQLVRPDDHIGTVRNYELQHLINPPFVATAYELENVQEQFILFSYFQKLLPSYQRKIYNEKKFSFDPHFFKAGKNIYLKGYRQSEQYFLSIESQIRNDFRLQPQLIAPVTDFAQSISSENSIAVHIRRGDYTNPIVKEYHGILTQEYYQQAINTIAQQVSKPCFYIFSDNIDWVKDHLQFMGQVTFVSGNISATPYHDFFLMSQCRHNIIANSSFSWWAAWLNNNPSKVIVAPQKWFNQAPIDDRDLVPASWIRI